MSPKDIAVWVHPSPPSPEHEYPREALGFRMQRRSGWEWDKSFPACQNCWFPEAEEPLQTRFCL